MGHIFLVKFRLRFEMKNLFQISYRTTTHGSVILTTKKGLLVATLVVTEIATDSPVAESFSGDKRSHHQRSTFTDDQSRHQRQNGCR